MIFTAEVIPSVKQTPARH